MQLKKEEMENIHQNKFCYAKYHRPTKILFSEYEGRFDYDLTKELMEKIMEYAVHSRISGAVQNLTMVKGTFTKLNPWFKEVFYPHMIPLGYQCWGAAVANDPFTRFAINALIGSMTPRGFQAKVFSEIDSAEKWVFNQLSITI